MTLKVCIEFNPNVCYSVLTRSSGEYFKFFQEILKGGFKMDDPRIAKLQKNDSTQGIPTNGSVDDESAGLIVPPGLYDYIPMFEDHYRSAKEKKRTLS